VDKISKKIKVILKIKKILETKNLDGYIIPKNDVFFSEYSNPDRLKLITKFSGSAGLAVITRKKNLIFVDGRYIIQAENECGKKFDIFEIPFQNPKKILGQYKKGLYLGYDPDLFTSKNLINNFGYKHTFVPLKNIFEKYYQNKNNRNTKRFYSLDEIIVGESVNSKLKRLIKILNKIKIDNIFISAPENVAWLLNIRGFDNPNSPIPNCRIILTKKKEVFFFSDLNKIKKIKKNPIYKKFSFFDFSNFAKIISILKGKSFCIDENTCSIFNESIIKSKFVIRSRKDPCYFLKSIKNKRELQNIKLAHIKDGVALTKFIYLFKNKKTKWTELKAVKILENLRKKNNNYLYPSFNTIAGSGPNSAIIHYKSNPSTNRIIKKKDIFLLDSGGQYKYGTTDVTRTLCQKKPKKFIRNIYTRVLKGHISVVKSNLNKIKTGNEIDNNARKWLKQIKLDYAHGTGHGVGFFLNVHEGPQGLSKFNEVKLNEGMVVSNEPGYYRKNKFGIRIENMIYIDKEKNNLKFKNLTYVPIDKDLIDYTILNKSEKEYLFEYHLEVYNLLSQYLNKKEKNWLVKLI